MSIAGFFVVLLSQGGRGGIGSSRRGTCSGLRPPLAAPLTAARIAAGGEAALAATASAGHQVR